jgi:hypothetical protein
LLALAGLYANFLKARASLFASPFPVLTIFQALIEIFRLTTTSFATASENIAAVNGVPEIAFSRAAVPPRRCAVPAVGTGTANRKGFRNQNQHKYKNY